MAKQILDVGEMVSEPIIPDDDLIFFKKSSTAGVRVDIQMANASDDLSDPANWITISRSSVEKLTDTSPKQVIPGSSGFAYRLAVEGSVYDAVCFVSQRSRGRERIDNDLRD